MGATDVYRRCLGGPRLSPDAPLPASCNDVSFLPIPFSLTTDIRTLAMRGVELTDLSASVSSAVGEPAEVTSGGWPCPARGRQRCQWNRRFPWRRCLVGIERWLKVTGSYFLIKEASKERDCAWGVCRCDSLVQ